MFCLFVFCCSSFWHLVVFAETVIQKSVTEGDSVALESGLTGLQDHDLITWTFGDSQTVIAQIEMEGTGSFNTFDVPDGRFRDRLKLDQNGSLTITNTRTIHSGNYTVNIKHSNNNNITNRFNVIVYGTGSHEALTAAAVVGSVLIVAAVGIFCFYKKYRKTDQEGTIPTRNEELTYADPTFFKQKAQKARVKQEDEVVYAGVLTRN